MREASSKIERDQNFIVPWFAYLAVFIVGLLLIWLPGSLINLFDRVVAGFLSELLGAGLAGVGFGGVAFGIAAVWPGHARLWGVFVSFPSCALMLGWLAINMPSQFSLTISVLFTVVVCMGLSVVGGHLGAVWMRHRMKERTPSGDVLVKNKTDNSASAVTIPQQNLTNKVKMLFRGDSLNWLGWLRMKESTSNRLTGLVALLLGLAGLLYVGEIMILAAGQHDWVPVEAVVIESYTTKSSKGSGFRSYTSHHFKYSYQVDGLQYTGDRYSFWSVSGEPGTGTAHYRLGDNLTVYHHPTWPRYAVVEFMAPSFFTWLFGFLALLIAIPGSWMLWSGTASG